ncbi:MAG: hypothetical protein P4L44_04860 [Oryzomonas sp.]|uniref:hypothetical protein n=1 Tax=Oryzomonas sp. TaxID=2855186 RepID=UPI00283DB9B8|nr:hypothetical protein [Oryzomonas sp.]MDR3579276.1 hypothetical protein [Oryzomonas sp.]
MARFYDTTDTHNRIWIENLLKHGGIGYSIREVGKSPSMTEISVAEEDLEHAEALLNSSIYPI